MNKVFSHIRDILASPYTDSVHVRRNAGIQIVAATLAFIMLIRVYPMGLVRDHTYSGQKAFDASAGEIPAGDPFTPKDKKLQTVYFQKGHIYRMTLYMSCTAGDKDDTVVFRLYDDAFSCIYEEEAGCKRIAADNCLKATPDLDVEADRAYYYEILVPEECGAAVRLPVADRGALAQMENSTLYIDGVINDGVCLIADFDYSSPLTAAGVLGYGLLILITAFGVYFLACLAVAIYDERFGRNGAAGKVVRAGITAAAVLAAAALLVFAVVRNKFGGEVWDRLFFLAGILAGTGWLVTAIWFPIWYPKPTKQLKISVKGKIALIWRNYIQTVSFGFLFYALCQYVNADRNYYHYTNTRWMLIFLAIAFLMNYSEKLFMNRFSAIWLVLGVTCSVLYCRSVDGDENTVMLAKLTCGVVVAWGLLALNILLAVANERNLSIGELALSMRKNRQNAVHLVLWVAFALLTYLYRYEKVWVYTATLPFAALLFRKSSDAEKSRFLRNFTNGILLSFGLTTLFSLLHRPHHYWMLYRYGGMFHTVACTGMYLAVVFGAALAKLYGRIKDKRNMFLRCSLEYFLTACAAGFILLTMSRTALLTTVVTVIAVVLLAAVTYHKTLRRIFAELGMLAIVCIMSFPMVYSAVRMVPAVVNDPIRYEIEFQDRGFMIYEGDPIDSDKYMTVRRFFTTLFGRFQTEASASDGGDPGEDARMVKPVPPDGVLLAYTGNDFAGAQMRTVSGGEEAADEGEDGSDFSNGRFKIFLSYLKELKMKGHPGMGPRNDKGVEYAHAHNSYLQVAYNFGMIAGGIFLVLCALAFWKGIRLFCQKGNRFGIFLVPFALVVVFGIVSLTEWTFHPCIPAGFCFMLMQVFLMK